MGFFSGIGKAIKNVTKAVSFNNVIKVSTGRADEVIKEVVNRTKDGIKMIGGSMIGSLVPSKGGSSASVVSASAGVQAVNPYGSVKLGKDNVIKLSSGSLKDNFSNVLINPVKAVKTSASTQFASKDKLSSKADYTGIPAVDNAVQKEVDKLNNIFTDASGKIFQKPEIKGVLDWFEKNTRQYYWAKYKTQIIVGLCVLVSGLVWFFKFRKPKRGRRTR